MDKNEERTPFSRQPARIALVDFTPPFDADVCENIITAFSNIFSIVCSLAGPCRAPFFGLFAVGSYPEVLFPLQHVRNNFPRLSKALSELRVFQQDTSHASWTRSMDTSHASWSCSSISQAVQEAVSMFKRLAQGLIQTAGFWSQLEIIIFSCQNVNKISKETEKVVRDLDVESLKKVQLVCLQNPNFLSMDDAVTNSQMSNTSETSTGEATNLVEVLLLDQDILTIENLAKGWLLDYSTDREHLHIMLPADKDEEAALVIKCDLQERLISPSHLPSSAQFELSVESAVTRPHVNQMNSNKTTLPVYKLIATKMFPEESICESIVYGIPLIVCATSCWKIDWDELESNQHYFYALCHRMYQKKQVLLCHLKKSPTPNNRFRSPVAASTRYLVFASSSNTLLIKPVSVNELMLPCDVLTPLEAPDPVCLEKINKSLDQLENLDSYNPLTEKSGLYESLHGILNKNIGYAAQGNSKQIMGSTSTMAKRKPLGRTVPTVYQRPGSHGGNTSELPIENVGEPNKKARLSSGKNFYSKKNHSFPTEL